MEDQISKLNKLTGINAGTGGESEEENASLNYIFVSPEMLENQTWRKSVHKLNVCTIVVDEFHTMYTWGGLNQQDEETAFRKSFRLIGEMRTLFPTASMLALSATCTKEIYKAVFKALGFEKSSTTIIIKSPEKSNIKFVMQKIDASMEISMQWLIDALDDLNENFPRTIIYTNSIKQLSDLYEYIYNEVPRNRHMLDMFHSETPEENKADIIKDLQDNEGKLRIVLATSALGMGIDIKNCHSVILYGATKELVDLLQEVGRAGRDGQPSVALILYNRYHLAQLTKDVKRILLGTFCRRLAILENFLSKKDLQSVKNDHHGCCDICASKCTCGQCVMPALEKLFLDLKIETNEDVDSDSDTELYYEEEFLNEFPEMSEES